MSKNNRPIIIAQIEPPQADTTGDYYYRTYAPGLAMSQMDNVYFIGLTSLHRNLRKIISAADVLVLKNICDVNLIPLLDERYNNSSTYKPVVYEIADDMFNIPPWNPVHSFYENIESRQIMKKTIVRCDGLQFPSKQLEMLYEHLQSRHVEILNSGRLKSNCAVFPNQITIIPPDRPSQNGKGTLNIGWGGSHGHLEDIRAIQVPLSKWLRETKNARLHLMCSDPIWNLFDDVPHDNKIRYKPGTIYDYYGFLKNIDIGIAPLEDTPFNRSRSDVKYLEFAVNEAVPVVQDMVTYRNTVQHGKTGYFFKNEYDLVSILDALAADPAENKHRESGKTICVRGASPMQSCRRKN